MTTASFAPTRVVAGGGATGVITEVVPVMEEKMVFTLVLVMVVIVHVVVAI